MTFHHRLRLHRRNVFHGTKPQRAGRRLKRFLKDIHNLPTLLGFHAAGERIVLDIAASRTRVLMTTSPSGPLC